MDSLAKIMKQLEAKMKAVEEDYDAVFSAAFMAEFNKSKAPNQALLEAAKFTDESGIK